MTRTAIVFGTFNRLELLKKAVASVRQAVGQLAYQIIIVDGGSTDGSREWLADQSDVVLIGQRGELTGAVRAFNCGFAYAVDNGFEYVMHLNDDAEIITDNAIERAVLMMEKDPKIGEVAFAFDLWGEYKHDHINGVPYGNYGVIRREAGMHVARAQGDVGGRAWWNPIYRTYGADTEFGVWLWRLGWKIHATMELKVHDHREDDQLRASNMGDRREADSQLFWSRWRDEKLSHLLEQ